MNEKRGLEMNINKIAERIGILITGAGLVMLAIIFVLVVK